MKVVTGESTESEASKLMREHETFQRSLHNLFELRRMKEKNRKGELEELQVKLIDC